MNPSDPQSSHHLSRQISMHRTSGSDEHPAQLHVVYDKLETLLQSRLFKDLPTLIGSSTSELGSCTNLIIHVLNLYAHAQLVDELVSREIRKVMRKHVAAKVMKKKGAKEIIIQGRKRGMVGKDILPQDIEIALDRHAREFKEEEKRRGIYAAWSSMLRMLYLNSLIIHLHQQLSSDPADRPQSSNTRGRVHLSNLILTHLSSLFPVPRKPSTSESHPEQTQEPLFFTISREEERKTDSKILSRMTKVVMDYDQQGKIDLDRLPPTGGKTIDDVKKHLLEKVKEIISRKQQVEDLLNEWQERKEEGTEFEFVPKLTKRNRVSIKQEGESERSEIIFNPAERSAVEPSGSKVTARVSKSPRAMFESPILHSHPKHSPRDVSIPVPLHPGSQLTPGTLWQVDDAGHLVEVEPDVIDEPTSFRRIQRPRPFLPVSPSPSPSHTQAQVQARTRAQSNPAGQHREGRPINKTITGALPRPGKAPHRYYGVPAPEGEDGEDSKSDDFLVDELVTDEAELEMEKSQREQIIQRLPRKEMCRANDDDDEYDPGRRLPKAKSHRKVDKGKQRAVTPTNTEETPEKRFQRADTHNTSPEWRRESRHPTRTGQAPGASHLSSVQTDAAQRTVANHNTPLVPGSSKTSRSPRNIGEWQSVSSFGREIRNVSTSASAPASTLTPDAIVEGHSSKHFSSIAASTSTFKHFGAAAKRSLADTDADAEAAAAVYCNASERHPITTTNTTTTTSFSLKPNPPKTTGTGTATVAAAISNAMTSNRNPAHDPFKTVTDALTGQKRQKLRPFSDDAVTNHLHHHPQAPNKRIKR